MEVFGNGDEPCLKFKVLIVGVDFVKSSGKGADGDVLGIVLIFGSKNLKTVHIVPKSIYKGAKGNLVSFFCFLDILFNGIFLQSCSSGSFPQNPHASPSLFKKGLWLAQVPANSPFFFPQILMAIPANASAKSPMVTNTNFIIQLLHKGTK